IGDLQAKVVGQVRQTQGRVAEELKHFQMLQPLGGLGDGAVAVDCVKQAEGNGVDLALSEAFLKKQPGVAEARRQGGPGEVFEQGIGSNVNQGGEEDPVGADHRHRALRIAESGHAVAFAVAAGKLAAVAAKGDENAAAGAYVQASPILLVKKTGARGVQTTR